MAYCLCWIAMAGALAFPALAADQFQYDSDPAKRVLEQIATEVKATADRCTFNMTRHAVQTLGMRSREQVVGFTMEHCNTSVWQLQGMVGMTEAQATAYVRALAFNHLERLVGR